jgi:hypothetical protein
MKTIKKQGRQGDVLLTRVASIPEGGKVLPTKVVAVGEATGHNHVLGGNALLIALEDDIFARMTVASPLVHEEHSALVFEEGSWGVSHQYEYTPQEVPQVRD